MSIPVPDKLKPDYPDPANPNYIGKLFDISDADGFAAAVLALVAPETLFTNEADDAEVVDGEWYTITFARGLTDADTGKVIEIVAYNGSTNAQHGKPLRISVERYLLWETADLTGPIDEAHLSKEILPYALNRILTMALVRPTDQPNTIALFAVGWINWEHLRFEVSLRY